MLTPDAQKQVNEFFHGITEWRNGYRFAHFSYLAVVFDGRHIVIRARISLSPFGLPKPFERLATAHVLADALDLQKIGLTPEELVERLCEGRLQIGNTVLHFPANEAGNYSIYQTPFMAEPATDGHRVSLLGIHGGSPHTYFNKTIIDWELKSAETPYDNLEELSSALYLGPFENGAAYFDVIAQTIASIDHSSTVSGSRATIRIALAKDLNTDRASLGIRVYNDGVVIERRTIPHSRFQWTEEANINVGTTIFPVPPAAVIHCVGKYGDHAQNTYWVTDPETAQNPRRAIYQAFDNNLSSLSEHVKKEFRKGDKARDLETTVATLMWLLGFSVTHLGPIVEDAADLLATTPSGNLCLVECTTGVLKDDKLSNLAARAERVRKELTKSGHSNTKVLPVLVTSMTEDEVRVKTESAVDLGVLVITRESLNQAIEQTRLWPDSEKIFSDGLSRLSGKNSGASPER